jgi:hypothetical protein
MMKHKQRNSGVAPYKIVMAFILLGIIGTLYYVQTHFDLKPRYRNSQNRKTRRNVKVDDPLQDLLGDLESDEGGILNDDADDNDAFMKNELEPQNSNYNTNKNDDHKSDNNNEGSKGNDKNKILKFKNANGVSAYLGTVEFKRDPFQPMVDGLPHFSGIAYFGSGQQVQLHLTSPKGDPYWYITLKDLMKKDSNGRNITPIIAFTNCDDNSVNPWLPMARCLWTVHEGPERGWQKKIDLRMYQRDKY